MYWYCLHYNLNETKLLEPIARFNLLPSLTFIQKERKYQPELKDELKNNLNIAQEIINELRSFIKFSSSHPSFSGRPAMLKHKKLSTDLEMNST